jgi:hypothetical protein
MQAKSLPGKSGGFFCSCADLVRLRAAVNVADKQNDSCMRVVKPGLIGGDREGLPGGASVLKPCLYYFT